MQNSSPPAPKTLTAANGIEMVTILAADRQEKTARICSSTPGRS
jgi:hypothetical protein